MVAVLMMSAKLVTLDLLKIKVFWNKGYDVIISVYDINNKILSRDSNYIVDVARWSKFRNSNISMRSYHKLSFVRIWPEKPFFSGELLVEVQQLRAGTRYGLEILDQCGKRIKTTNQKVLDLIPMFVEATGEKLVGGFFAPHPHPPSWTGLMYEISDIVK